MPGNAESIFGGIHRRELQGFQIKVNENSIQAPEGYLLEAELHGLSESSLENNYSADPRPLRYVIRISFEKLIELRDAINRKIDVSCKNAQVHARKLEEDKSKLLGRVASTLGSDEDRSSLIREFR